MHYIKIDPFFRRLFILIAMGVLLYAMYLLQAVILPFVIAFALAYFTNPLVNWLVRRIKIRRWLAILLVFFGLSVGLVGVGWWLAPMVWEQLQALYKALPAAADFYNNNIRNWVSEHTKYRLMRLNWETLSKSTLEYVSKKYNTTDMTGIFNTVLLQGMNVVSIIGTMVLIPILMFYFLYNWDERLQSWRKSIPRPLAAKTVQIAKESDIALMSFLKGQLLVMILLGIVYAVQLQLIGLKVGIIIGMVAGVASFVPYLGFTLGFIAAIVAGFFQFGLDWMQLGLIVGAFMVGQAVEGYILQPLLLGDKIGLSPLWVIFAVLAGGALLGIAGMLIALPVAAVLNVFSRHLYQGYLDSHYYWGDKQLSLFRELNATPEVDGTKLEGDPKNAKKNPWWKNFLG